MSNTALTWRGTVEGFYGPPWSHRDRLAHLEFAAGIGLNTYVYAPKDEPYHRDRWRDRYPAADLRRLGELAATARELGIRFVCTISPGLSMRFAEDAEHAALAAKAEQLFDAGITSFGLLFDDLPQELGSPADVARFGAGYGGCGAAHGETCLRFADGFLADHGITEPLLVCPTDYAGTEPSAYRDELARTAPADVLVAWTGADVVVGAVTGADIDRAGESYRRRLVLWDNFPVNDFAPDRLFLGPLIDRAARGERVELHGVIANPMPQQAASRFALATVADWALDPDGYDPATAAEAALTTVAGDTADAIAPLVRACSSWPPSADQDPDLTTATTDALCGSAEAAQVVSDRLSELADGCRAIAGPAALVADLRPWLDGAVTTAEAGLAALRLLRAAGDGSPEVAAEREATVAALAAAEDHYATVLRPIVPPFVRAVLDLTAPPDTLGPDGRPAALLVTGPSPSAGDRAVAELLASHGFGVRHTGDAEDSVLVVVTDTAEPEAVAAVARAGVPLLAWRHTAELGLATAQRTIMTDGRFEITAPGDPLAAGRIGTVSVLRGPAWLTVADVDGTPAQVVARTADGSGATLFRYQTGDRLVDGTIAPAPRIGLFLGPAGPARWLLTEDGTALLTAALDLVLDRGVGAPELQPADV